MLLLHVVTMQLQHFLEGKTRIIRQETRIIRQESRTIRYSHI